MLGSHACFSFTLEDFRPRGLVATWSDAASLGAGDSRATLFTVDGESGDGGGTVLPLPFPPPLTGAGGTPARSLPSLTELRECRSFLTVAEVPLLGATSGLLLVPLTTGDGPEVELLPFAGTVLPPPLTGAVGKVIPLAGDVSVERRLLRDFDGPSADGARDATTGDGVSFDTGCGATLILEDDGAAAVTLSIDRLAAGDDVTLDFAGEDATDFVEDATDFGATAADAFSFAPPPESLIFVSSPFRQSKSGARSWRVWTTRNWRCRGACVCPTSVRPAERNQSARTCTVSTPEDGRQLLRRRRNPGEKNSGGLCCCHCWKCPINFHVCRHPSPTMMKMCRFDASLRISHFSTSSLLPSFRCWCHVVLTTSGVRRWWRHVTHDQTMTLCAATYSNDDVLFTTKQTKCTG